jgi:hypothetical protein
VKYGALSNGTGQVRNGWEPIAGAEQRKARLSWQESGRAAGGPDPQRVRFPPDRDEFRRRRSALRRISARGTGFAQAQRPSSGVSGSRRRLRMWLAIATKPFSGKFQATLDPLRSKHEVNRAAELIGN